MPDAHGIILDIGCGQGGFVAQCLKCGFKAAGIETSEKSREVARSAGLPVYDSIDAFVAENPADKVQAVAFSHVLEHLMDPLHSVQIVSQYAHDAQVYIEVPDAASYLSPNAVRWQEMYFEHLSHFRKHDISEFAKRSGIEIKKEGETAFSRSQKDICLFLVGRFSGWRKETSIRVFYDHEYTPIPQFSFVFPGIIPDDDRPLAIWGISQYAMLLIGSFPELSQRVTRMFDASAAKIGRRIRGIVIEPPDKISALSEEHVLLIPKSTYLLQMRDQLQVKGFKGQVIEV
jgi:SAM-dependent methyltransferase